MANMTHFPLEGCVIRENKPPYTREIPLETLRHMTLQIYVRCRANLTDYKLFHDTNGRTKPLAQFSSLLSIKEELRGLILEIEQLIKMNHLTAQNVENIDTKKCVAKAIRLNDLLEESSFLLDYPKDLGVRTHHFFSYRAVHKILSGRTPISVGYPSSWPGGALHALYLSISRSGNSFNSVSHLRCRLSF